MIKSNFARTPESEETPSVPWMFLAIAGVIAASSLRAIAGGRALPSPLELCVWYPMLVCSAGIALICWQRTGQKTIREDWSAVGPALAIGIMTGAFLSFLPFWPSDIAAMPLGLMELGQYLLTFGVFPFNAGPDALLRGFAWGASVTLAVREYQSGRELFRALGQALIAWLIISAVILLPSIILLLTLVAAGASPLTAGENLIAEFTRLNINTYWTNAQLVRWFTGFGGQAVRAWMLYSASWLLVLSAISANLAPLISLVKSKKRPWKPLGAGALAVAIGCTAGWSHQAWSRLDAAAWLVFLTLIIILIRAYERPQSSQTQSWIQWLAAALLGWPVILGILPVALLNETKNTYAPSWMNRHAWIGQSVFWGLLAFAAGIFVRRGDVLRPEMVWMLAGFFLLAGAACHISGQYAKNGFSLRLVTVWIVASGLASLALSSAFPITTGIFSAALIVAVARWKPANIAFIGWILWATIPLILVFSVWLPRYADPRLIPL